MQGTSFCGGKESVEWCKGCVVAGEKLKVGGRGERLNLGDSMIIVFENFYYSLQGFNV